MSARGPAPSVVGAILSASVLAACGGGPGGGGAAGPPPSGPLEPPQQLPSAAGKTLVQLRRGLGPGPRLASTVSVLEPGSDRVAFALFDRARRQIGEAPAALYVANADGRHLRGPFQARYESLAVGRRYRSATVASDPDAVEFVYVSRATFPGPGRYRLMGVVQLDQRLVATKPVTVTVRAGWRVPDVGQTAPRVHTPTAASAAGRLQLIDTRSPRDSMHDEDLADVLGRRPLLLLFSSPGQCRSHVCGSVVDALAELKGRRGRDAAFIHMETYRNNDPRQGARDQVRAYGLPSQPWLFAIDRHGRVAARIEGAFSEREAEQALDAAIRGEGVRE